MGRATALKFASEGALVYCVDINSDELEETSRLISAAGGKSHTAILDVGSAEDCQRAVADAAETLGGLDVVCNIAGWRDLSASQRDTRKVVSDHGSKCKRPVFC